MIRIENHLLQKKKESKRHQSSPPSYMRKTIDGFEQKIPMKEGNRLATYKAAYI